MRKQEFIDALYAVGWEATADAQHERINELWEKIFPSTAALEKEIPDLIETAHQAGQASAGVDPSYSEAKKFMDTTWP